MSISAELIGPAFVMGLAGSLHCVGMCGPLALSLPVSHDNNLSRISGGLIYNSGRILSYASMGLLFGSLGSLVIATKWQSGLSIALGIIILLYILFPKKYFHFSATTFLGKPFMLLRQQLGKLFQSKKLSSLLFIGVLNGFLPCGLVYLCLTSSIISVSPVNGGMFMLFFWIRNISNDVCNRIDGKLFEPIDSAENTQGCSGFAFLYGCVVDPSRYEFGNSIY